MTRKSEYKTIKYTFERSQDTEIIELLLRKLKAPDGFSGAFNIYFETSRGLSNTGSFDFGVLSFSMLTSLKAMALGTI